MSDLIDRQAVLGELKDLYIKNTTCNPDYGWDAAIDTITDKVKDLPSAQQEIISCKDCRWWDKSEDSPFGYCMAMKHAYMSANWEIGIYRRYKGDFYCADAERRSDE